MAFQDLERKLTLASRHHGASLEWRTKVSSRIVLVRLISKRHVLWRLQAHWM
jgi:hypothetical protein